MAKITNNNTKEINNLTINSAVILTEVKNITGDISEIKEKLGCLDDNFVGQKEFILTNKNQDDRINKIERLVYGALAVATTTLIKAVLDLVVTVQAR
jgi:hypothetical protein